MDEQEMQSKLMEIEMIKQQLTQLDQQRMQVNARLMDSDAALKTLNDLEIGTGIIETFVPFGGGIFSKATLPETRQVLVNVGQDIAVEKPVAEAKTIMEKTIAGYEKMFMDLDSNISVLQNHAESIYHMIEATNASKR